MAKRSRLRSDRRGKGRLFTVLVLTGVTLLLGLYFFKFPGVERSTQLHKLDSGQTDNLLDKRGTIFDRNFKELAVTLERVSLYANVRDIEVDEVATNIAPILDVNPDFIRSTIAKEPYRAWLAKNISQEEEDSVAQLGLRGVYFHKERARYYPQEKLASHLVGHVGKSMGLSGVEFRYNTLLNKYGTAFIESGAVEVDKSQSADIGQHLLLTVDLKIQRILEKFLNNLAVQEKDARIGALFMECQSGKIIASGNYPAYDPNIFHDADRGHLINILAEPTAVPQAMRRLLWDASLLQFRYEKDKQVLPWSIVSQERGLGSQLRLWDRLGLNDPLDVDYMQQRSSSAGESGNIVNLRKDQNLDSVVEVTTPMHMVAAINALVGGKLKNPHVIDKIAGKDGKVYRFSHENGETVVPATVATELQKLLDSQMQKGPLSSGFYSTESISYESLPGSRQYSRNQILISLIPRKDPKLMLFVFAELPTFPPSPTKTKNRFTMEEPARKIIVPMVALQEVMSNLSDMMTVEEKQEMNFDLQKETAQGAVAAGIDRQIIYGTMPDLKGYSLRKSLRELKDLGLEIQISGTGVVVGQSPSPGKRVKHGELCRLVLKPH